MNGSVFIQERGARKCMIVDASKRGTWVVDCGFIQTKGTLLVDQPGRILER